LRWSNAGRCTLVERRPSRHGEDAELLAIASKLATDLAESIEAAVPTIRV
jgi:hypothetical protein